MLGAFLSTTISLFRRFHHPRSLLLVRALNDHRPFGWVHYNRTTHLTVQPRPTTTCQPPRTPCRRLMTIILLCLIASSIREMVHLRVEAAIVGLHCLERMLSQTCAPHLDSLTRDTTQSYRTQRRRLLLPHQRRTNRRVTTPCRPLYHVDKILHRHLPRDLHDRKSKSNP